MGNIRYSDRVVYQICRRGPESFMISKLIGDVLERMAETGAKVTRHSWGCILAHILQLTRQRLLICGPEGEMGLSVRFAEVRVEKLSKDLTFTEHSLQKNKALIDLKVYRARNTTKKELYDENAELQDKLNKSKETVARLNQVIESFSTTVEERDTAMEECDAALETLRSLRAMLQMTPANSTRTEHQPMEVDTDESVHVHTLPASTQSGGLSLQRVPTVPDIANAGPYTPKRNTTAQLLMPPPTVEQTGRRLTRTSVSLSYRDFEEQPEGRPMDASGQSVAHDISSGASGSHTHLQGAAVPSVGATDTGEESFTDVQRRLARLADQTARKEFENSTRVEDLEQQVAVTREQAVVAEGRAQAAEEKLAASDATKAILEDKLSNDIAQHNQQVADYERWLEQSKAECLEQSLLTQEARAEAVHMRQNSAALHRRLVRAVEQSGSVATLANVHIAELSTEVVNGLSIIYQVGQRAQDFVHGIVAGATSFTQNITGQWPVAWHAN